MKYKFEITNAYPKRRFAVYEKKEGFLDKIRRILGIKEKKKSSKEPEPKKKGQTE